MPPVEEADRDIESRASHNSDADSDSSSTSTLIASTLIARCLLEEQAQEREEEEEGRTASRWHFVVAVLLVGNWIVLSSALILSNKYILDTLKFPFPIFLTCWHLFFASGMTQILAHTTGLLDSRHEIKMTREKYFRAIMPIGALYCGSLVFSNLPYLTLSVAFIQMLKGLGPTAVLLAAYSLGLEHPNWKKWVNITIIVFGVIVASFGEIKFVWSGFMYQMGGIVFEAYRLALIQRLLSSEDQKMDPLVSLYYYAPICTAMIAVVAAVGELPSLRFREVIHVGFGKFVANAGVAFSLNVASVMLIGKTSSLVLMLCGTLKNILLVLASVLIWGTAVTKLQVFGYGVTSVALLYYSLGSKTIHALFSLRRQSGKKVQTEKIVARRRWATRHVAFIMIVAGAVAGAVGGAVAGYNMDWDPRLYWYSATRFAESKIGT